MRQKYVVGFLIDKITNKIVLIRKINPEWQRGKLNGVGGKVNDGEFIYEAMTREFKEEAGLEVNEWREFLRLQVFNADIFFFVKLTSDPLLERTKSMTEEKLEYYSVDNIPYEQCIGNLRWIIPMALDRGELVGTVREDVI